MQVRSDRWYEVPADRDSVWEALRGTHRYRSWWPWLVEFDRGALAAGERWRCAVSPPLPYVVRFTIELTGVDPPDSVVAQVTGDVVGHARLDVVEAPDGCRIHLVSDLAPGNVALQVVAAAARPVVRRGHDWVLDTGARQFVERAF